MDVDAVEGSIANDAGIVGIPWVTGSFLAGLDEDDDDEALPTCLEDSFDLGDT